MPDNPYVRIMNNFLHDMATGTWAACLAVLLVFSGRLAGMPAEAAAALGATRRSLIVKHVSLFVI